MGITVKHRPSPRVLAPAWRDVGEGQAQKFEAEQQIRRAAIESQNVRQQRQLEEAARRQELQLAAQQEQDALQREQRGQEMYARINMESTRYQNRLNEIGIRGKLQQKLLKEHRDKLAKDAQDRLTAEGERLTAKQEAKAEKLRKTLDDIDKDPNLDEAQAKYAKGAIIAKHRGYDYEKVVGAAMGPEKEPETPAAEAWKKNATEVEGGWKVVDPDGKVRFIENPVVKAKADAQAKAEVEAAKAETFKTNWISTQALERQKQGMELAKAMVARGETPPSSQEIRAKSMEWAQQQWDAFHPQDAQPAPEARPGLVKQVKDWWQPLLPTTTEPETFSPAARAVAEEQGIDMGEEQAEGPAWPLANEITLDQFQTATGDKSPAMAQMFQSVFEQGLDPVGEEVGKMFMQLSDSQKKAWAEVLAKTNVLADLMDEAGRERGLESARCMKGKPLPVNPEERYVE